MKKLSFVIPCYNSEKTIGKVTDEIIQIVTDINKYDYEIILVNDFSKDNTLSVIRRLCDKNEKIKGLSLAKNFGQPSATLAGCEISSGEIIVYSDDDGQTPLDELYSLLSKLEEGYDVVFADFSVKKSNFFHNIGSRINNKMAEVLLRKPKGLYMGSFWVCESFVVKNAILCNNPFPYLAGIFLSITRNMTSVPTSHRVRLEGKSNYTLKKMISLWLNGFTAFSIMPLRIASLIGLITSLSGFLYIIIIFYHKFKYPTIPTGYSSIMSAILFIGGMIMVMLGLLGEYIGRIYININNTPQYVIKEKFNID